MGKERSMVKMPSANELKTLIEKIFEGAGSPLKKNFIDSIEIQILKAKNFCNEKEVEHNFDALKENNNTKKNCCCCYMFFYHSEESQKGYFLKIGQHDKNNSKRRVNSHYSTNPNYGGSTLAMSLYASPNYPKLKDNKNNGEKIGNWIMENCTRINIFFDEERAKEISGSGENFVLNLLEAALHYRYKPEFEGKTSKPKSN